MILILEHGKKACPHQSRCYASIPVPVTELGFRHYYWRIHFVIAPVCRINQPKGIGREELILPGGKGIGRNAPLPLISSAKPNLSRSFPYLKNKLANQRLRVKRNKEILITTRAGPCTRFWDIAVSDARIKTVSEGMYK
jgi:hypothetical protein